MTNIVTILKSKCYILIACCVSLLSASNVLSGILIDDFSQQAAAFVVFADAGSTSSGSTGLPQGSVEEADRNPALTLGGHRLFESESPTLTGFSFAFAGRSGDRGFFDLAVEGPAAPSTAVGQVTWNGNGMLNANLSGMHRFELDVHSVEYGSFADVVVDRSFDLWVGVSSPSGSASVSRSIVTGTGAQVLSWDLAEFAGVDFSDVHSITLSMAIDFDGVENFERYTLFVNQFTAVPEPLTTAGFGAAALLGFGLFRRQLRRVTTQAK